MPGMFGNFGRFNWPTALTTTVADIVSVEPSARRRCTVHSLATSSYSARVTSAPSRTYGSTPNSVAQSRR